MISRRAVIAIATIVMARRAGAQSTARVYRLGVLGVGRRLTNAQGSIAPKLQARMGGRPESEHRLPLRRLARRDAATICELGRLQAGRPRRTRSVPRPCAQRRDAEHPHRLRRRRGSRRPRAGGEPRPTRRQRHWRVALCRSQFRGQARGASQGTRAARSAHGMAHQSCQSDLSHRYCDGAKHRPPRPTEALARTYRGSVCGRAARGLRRGREGPGRRARRDHGLGVHLRARHDREARREAQTTGSVSSTRLRRGRRSDLVWRKLFRALPTRRRPCRQDPPGGRSPRSSPSNSPRPSRWSST
jgi:hypothetical protein